MIKFENSISGGESYEEVNILVFHLCELGLTEKDLVYNYKKQPDITIYDKSHFAKVVYLSLNFPYCLSIFLYLHRL